MKRPNTARALISMFGLLAITFLLNISMGNVTIPLGKLLQSFVADTGVAADILWQFRIPKALTCVLAGGALATGGLLMQTLFRNPLAGPDVLGLTSGSSLLVALLLMIGTLTPGLNNALFQSPWSVAIAASMGGILVFILIIFIAHYVKDNTALLIVGLMVSAASSALVNVLQFTSQASDLQAFVIWMMGSVGGTEWPELVVLSILVLVGVALSYALIKPLNSLLLGENYAAGLQVNIKQARFWIVVATGLMTGAVTAFCGPIAFVGLAVPHLVRLILPVANHKVLIPAVVLGGAVLLLVCDVLAQLPGSTQILPLNAVTSLIGAPVVIWMVIKAKRISV